MIRRNKTVLRLTAAALTLGIMMSIPQAAFAGEYSRGEEVDLNANSYLYAKDKNGVEWKYYKKSNGTIAICGTFDIRETIDVPEELDGYKVSEIYEIVDEVKFSQKYSDWQERLKKVKTVIIPEGINIISGHTLRLFINLENVNIPSTVNIIGSSVFPAEWLNDNKDSNGLVIKQGILIDGHKASGDVKIPSEVRCIADGAFYYNQNITNVQIPSSVKRIGETSFSGCGNLVKVTMENGLEVIGDEAFANCKSLIEANAPLSVTEMGEDVFKSTPKLERPIENIEGLKIIDGVLKDAKDAKGDIVIPSNVTVIETGAFSDNKNIKSVKIPPSVTTIHARAFNGSSIEKVNIPSKVNTIEWGVFENCTNLKEVEIEEGVVAIDNYAFSMCASLTKITIPDSVTIISYRAFLGCRKLNEVKYKEGTSVDECAFEGTPWEATQKGYKDEEIIGDRTTPGWFQKDGDWYYLNDYGTLERGLFSVSTRDDIIIYHCDEKTGKRTTGWLKSGDSWHYFDQDGKGIKLKWFQDTDGKWYYFDQVGCMRNSGWYGTEEGKSYYFNEDGSTKKGWFKYNNRVWYHTDLQTGERTIGWFQDTNGKWYYFNKYGERQSGWFKDTDGTWYHLKADGEMSIGWFQDTNGKWYYFNANGSRRSGWLKDTDGKWYYLKADGEMATGWIQDTDGKWYYLYSNGSMAYNTYIGSYYVGASGAWIR